MDTSKSATSVMFAVAASGVMLPPDIVYKADHIWQIWTERGPNGARYNRSKSGKFDQNLFEDWFVTIALDCLKKLTRGPKVLIGDNLASHLSLKVITVYDMPRPFIVVKNVLFKFWIRYFSENSAKKLA